VVLYDGLLNKSGGIFLEIGFDNDRYIGKQTEEILKRIEQFDNKLYLEFGGKLFDDYHASRVLPGFDVNAKVKLLQTLSDKSEIIFTINAGDIERKKIRADFGITYDMDVLRLIDNLTEWGIQINSVVITQYTGQPSADIFRKRLEIRGVRTYMHTLIKGYPLDIDTIVSDEGYGSNPYIETTRPLVVVTAPGPGSGKLATCLSQLYHEYKRGTKAGYAKFETFPIWNLPLKHPVNIAYEAATADLKDVNMIDPFHFDAYDKNTVNYNRDIEIFPVVRNILARIMENDTLYRSPTDMGVNMAAYGIFNDDVVREAGRQEIIRRYFKLWCDYKQGQVDEDVALRVDLILKELNLKPENRAVVGPALEKANQEDVHAAAIMLKDGRIVTGKGSSLMNAPSSLILNSIKVLSGIADEIHLISPIVLKPILALKENVLGNKNSILNMEEILIALSISAATNPTAQLAMTKLGALRNCEAHSSVMLSQADESVLRKMGINLTCEPKFPSKDLYFV
jgi:uncharacterized protein (UPF0371 family)